MLSIIANISYILASKHDVQMSKRLQRLGGLRPHTPYRGSAPGLRWGTFVPQTAVPPYLQILTTPLAVCKFVLID